MQNQTGSIVTLKSLSAVSIWILLTELALTDRMCLFITTFYKSMDKKTNQQLLLITLLTSYYYFIIL